MQKLVDLSKKNFLLGILIRVACFIGLHLISIWMEICGWLRVHGIGSDRYKSLLKIKGKHEGERCFIICTGPSLTVEDCELLKNEKTFCMNSFVKVMDKTDFRPTYYGVQDVNVYKELKNLIVKNFKNEDTVFIADRIVRHTDVDPKWNIFPLNMAYCAYNRWFNEKFEAKFSGDVYREVYDGYSITMSLLQIAFYMGFKEIYLLGADCSFLGEKRHFAEYSAKEERWDLAKDRNLAGYMAVKNYTDAHGVEVFNSTRGGELELFPRIELEKILGI